MDFCVFSRPYDGPSRTFNTMKSDEIPTKRCFLFEVIFLIYNCLRVLPGCAPTVC